MARLQDPAIRQLLEAPNHAVVATLNEDGSVHATVVWISLEDGELAVNSAQGRHWPTNLDRDPTITVVVYDQGNPYDYVEIRGRATGTRDDANDHIDRLTKKYIDQDKYPFLEPGEVRVKYVIEPLAVRHQKQG